MIGYYPAYGYPTHGYSLPMQLHGHPAYGYPTHGYPAHGPIPAYGYPTHGYPAHGPIRRTAIRRTAQAPLFTAGVADLRVLHCCLSSVASAPLTRTKSASRV